MAARGQVRPSRQTWATTEVGTAMRSPASIARAMWRTVRRSNRSKPLIRTSFPIRKLPASWRRVGSCPEAGRCRVEAAHGVINVVAERIELLELAASTPARNFY